MTSRHFLNAHLTAMALVSRQPWFFACRPFEEFVRDQFLAVLKHCRGDLALRVDLKSEWGMPDDIKWTCPMTLAFTAHMSDELGASLVPKSFKLENLVISPDPSEPGLVHVSGKAVLVLSRCEKTAVGRKWMERAFAVARRAAAYVSRAETGHVVVHIGAKEVICTEAVELVMQANGLGQVRVSRATPRCFVFSW